MYVCVCTYVSVHERECVDEGVRAQQFVCVSVCVCECECVCVCVCLCVCAHAHASVCVSKLRAKNRRHVTFKTAFLLLPNYSEAPDGRDKRQNGTKTS